MTIIRKKLSEIKSTKAQIARAAAIRDEDIDCSDIPELPEEDFARARIVTPEARALRLMGVERGIVDQLGEEGRPLEDILNEALRAYLAGRTGGREKRTGAGVQESRDPFAGEDEEE